MTMSMFHLSHSRVNFRGVDVSWSLALRASPWPGRKRGTESQAIGKSRVGLTTKILALTDTFGNLVRFDVLPGQRYDTIYVEELVKGIEFCGLMADKAFDASWIIVNLTQRSAKIVISQKVKGLRTAALDRELLLQTEGVQTNNHATLQD